MSTLKTFLRTAFNSITPRRFYKPLFKEGDFIKSKDSSEERFDLPRYEGDTLFSVFKNSNFKIDAISYGFYKKDLDNDQGAVFVHDKLSGTPHYELSDLNEKRFLNNYNQKYEMSGSKIHVSVDIVESNFEKL